MASKGALKLVLMRNVFYRDGYKRLLFALLLLIAVDLMLAFGIFYSYTHPPEPQYFATTPDGRIITIHPLSDPVLSDQQVLQWVSQAVMRIYERDFVHWKDQLQQVSGDFTNQGWRDFIAALHASDNLNTVIKLKMVSSAKITGAPVITEKEVISGTYAWKIVVPVLVSYVNSSTKHISQPLEITLIVLRVPVQYHPDRIAINNFIPQTSGG
ncbi:MAG: type IVB secretion system apparatus protein IcmL/DotI [Coxiellaceae bacterium]|nr:type IVB secretion system apparatus protein IcmL/DotI [Coxiellaceae bacterium]